MRTPALLATLVALSTVPIAGCLSGGDADLEALQLTANQDDAHCQSLLMRPGSLVYAQCRLALRKTYLKDYAARKALIQQQYGPVVQDNFDQALRSDAFCNYDESVKAALEQADENAAAALAYDNCGTTRGELEQAFASAVGGDTFAFTSQQQPVIIQQNVEAVREAKIAVNGPQA